MNLIAELSHHVWLREGILAQCPDLDETTLADTLEGISNLDQAIILVARSIADDECLHVGLKDHLAKLGERLDRLEDRIAKKRELIAAVMERAELRKVVAPDATISLARVGPKVIITDEAAIPLAYKVPPIPLPPRPDRRAIKEALLNGAAIPGATLSNGSQTITIRRS